MTPTLAVFGRVTSGIAKDHFDRNQLPVAVCREIDNRTGAIIEIVVAKSLQFLSGEPLIAAITSPNSIPACAAGLPGWGRLKIPPLSPVKPWPLANAAIIGPTLAQIYPQNCGVAERCACAANGHAPIAQPSKVMNSRRLIDFSES